MDGNSCLNAFQHKNFPVGVYSDTLFCVEFLMNRQFGPTPSDTLSDEPEIVWYYKAYISKYDLNQRLFSTSILDTGIVNFEDKTVLAKLKTVFSTGMKQIKTNQPAIKNLTPEYLSLCDFQQKCNIISLVHNKNLDSSFIVYNKKSYFIDIPRDSLHNEAYRNMEGIRISSLQVSSIRIFRHERKKLIFIHLGTGDEIHMGYLTDDASKKGQTIDGFPITICKENKPSFPFTTLSNSVYIEPILHHGFGVDAFLVLSD
ncbi:MAG TPA: hypothetical protein DEP18_00855 [Flavobacteriales bacterium]|nr:hypothetical protein [Flavobacteriales bacterium]